MIIAAFPSLFCFIIAESRASSLSQYAIIAFEHSEKWTFSEVGRCNGAKSGDADVKVDRYPRRGSNTGAACCALCSAARPLL